MTRRDSVLSEISQRSVEADGIRKTIADLMAERDRLDAAIKQQAAALSDGAERLRADQEQAKAATDTIAKAGEAEKRLSNLRTQNADLEKQISVNQAKVEQLNADVARAEDKKRATDDALATNEKVRRDREAEISRLSSEIQNLDEKRREVSDLEARRTTLASQIAKITKDIADKQRESQELDTNIAKLHDQAANAKISAAKTDADMARQESSRAELADQVSALETKKASLTGDLTSLAAAADRARSDLASAEGRSKAAQDAVAEAEKAIPVLKAQLNDVRSEIAAASTQRDGAKAELAGMQAIKAKIAIDQADVDHANAEKTALDKAVADLRGRHAELAKELELKQGDLNTIKAELADLNGRKGALVQQIATLSDAELPKPAEAVSDPRLLARKDVELIAKRVLREFEENLGSTYTRFQYAPLLLVGLLRWRVVEPFALIEGQDLIADKLVRAVEKTLLDLRRKDLARLHAKYGRILEQVLEELRGEGSNPELLLDIYGGADGEDADD